jgi:hypothetical protein
MPPFHTRFIILTAISLSKQTTTEELVSLTCQVPTLLAKEITDDSSNEIVYDDPLKLFYRKRNAHACMMSIVFIVLYPLGAKSLHLPLPGFFRNVKIVPRVHVPIQILALAMMIGALGLGIDVTNDLHFFSSRSVPAHVVIGLLVTCTIILVQPAMGILQHLHFRRTGGKSRWVYIHRWTGRVAIILGMINQSLGYHLVGIGTVVRPKSLVRSYVLLRVLGGIWFALAMWDWARGGLIRRSDAIGNKEKQQTTGLVTE